MLSKKMGLPPEEIPFFMLLHELSKLFHDHMRREGEKIGLQSGYHHILFHLVREDGKAQLDLTKRTHLTAPTISVALQKMELEGLVTRASDSDDLRQTRVYITQKGRQLHKTMTDKFSQAEEAFIRNIPSEEMLLARKVLLNIRNTLLTEVGDDCKKEAD